MPLSSASLRRCFMLEIVFKFAERSSRVPDTSNGRRQETSWELMRCLVGVAVLSGGGALPGRWYCQGGVGTLLQQRSKPTTLRRPSREVFVAGGRCSRAIAMVVVGVVEHESWGSS